MSANADSVRFKFACNVHDWAYFEKIFVSGKTEFLPKIAYGLWQEISCFKVLVVSDIKVIFKCCKRSRHSESLWFALKWGLNFGWLTQRFMKIVWCSFNSFEQCIFLSHSQLFSKM